MGPNNGHLRVITCLKALAPVTAALGSKELLEERRILPNGSESMDVTERRLHIKLEPPQSLLFSTPAE
jgi:hypothetical protein